MRPKLFSYTFAALDADGYITSVNTNAKAVGVAFTLAASGAGDGCSHPVTVYSAADISGVVFTITGTDAERRTISEDITGPDTSPTTNTSTKYFATVTSIVKASGAGGEDAFTVGWTAVAHTPIYPVDFPRIAGPMIVCDIGGTINYTAQQTSGDVWATAADSLGWSPVAAISGATTDLASNALAGATGVRILVNSHTSGTLTLTYSQARAE